MTGRTKFTAAFAAGALLAAPAAASAKHRPPPPPPPASTAAPIVSGGTVTGSRLSSTKGTWSGSPTSFAYQWWQCSPGCTPIPGATAATFTLTSAQVGDTIESEVTATNAGGSTSAFSAPTAVVTAAPPPTPAVAYQLNGAHTGATPDALSSTPQALWSDSLPGTVSYPLIVGGSVYVTVADAASNGSSLYSLSAVTGATQWGPVELGGTYHFSGIAYDSGEIFAVNGDGLLKSFNASTGAAGWSTQLPGQTSFTSPPTAAAGLVYTSGAGSGGTLYAVNESNGSLAWSAPVMNGDHSSPALSNTGVYVSYACGQTYDFAPATGAPLWHHATSCEGGGGKTPVLANGNVYVRDSSNPAVLDASSGNLLSTFASSGPAPAVSATATYDLSGGILTAAGGSQWTFAGDGTLSSAPLVAGGTVVIAGTSGNVYGLNATTGTPQWTLSAGASVQAPDEQNAAQLTGLATSGGLLVVPAGQTLAAFK